MKLFLFLVMLSFSTFAQDLRALRVENFFTEQVAQVLSVVASDSAHYQSLVRGGRAEIEVVDRDLIDNSGSLVDALGVPGKITLSQSRWLEFVREQRDVRLLVAHELLRAAGVPDDNYVVSRTLIRGAVREALSRPYCDLRVSLTVGREQRREVRGQGYAPAPYGGNVFMTGRNVDNRPQEEATSAAIQDIRERCEAAGYESFGYGAGTLSLERRNNNGTRRTEYKVTLAGVCSRTQLVRRARGEQQAEGCRKVRLCRELLAQDVVAPLMSEDMSALENASNQWNCQ